jgi:hypothetical protein
MKIKRFGGEWRDNKERYSPADSEVERTCLKKFIPRWTWAGAG